VLDPGELSTYAGVSGKVYFDAERNGEFDLSTDAKLKNEKILSLPDGTVSITDVNGSFSFYPETEGSYQYSIVDSDFQSTTQESYDTTFMGESIEGLDYGVWRQLGGDSMSIDLVTSPLICLLDNSVWVTITNHGVNNTSGKITLKFNEKFDDVQTTPDYTTLDSDQVVWEFEELRYLESRTFYLILKAPSIDDILEIDPTQEPDEIQLTFSAEVETSDFSAIDEYTELFKCSYDPNDKAASSTGDSFENYSYLDEALDYTIRFENLGNYPAFNVVIRDTLDKQLEWTSLEVISSSHDVETSLDKEGVLTFRFPDINLPPSEENTSAGHGYVKYRLQPKTSLPDPTTITNTAYIYFDQNNPIVTNTTESILIWELPSKIQEEDRQDSSQIKIYPNPVSETLFIVNSKNENDPISNIAILDNAGRMIVQYTEPKDQVKLFLNPGIYLLQITTENRLFYEKFVIK